MSATPDRASAPAPLAPCPFCGGPATIASRAVHGGPCWCAYCRNDECDVAPASDHHPTEEGAVAAWNRRTPTLLAALDGREAGCPVCALADARWSPHVEDKAWNKAIEEAASLCERRADGHKSGLSGLHKDAYAREGKWCAAAIRALARPQPAGEVGK